VTLAKSFLVKTAIMDFEMVHPGRITSGKGGHGVMVITHTAIVNVNRRLKTASEMVGIRMAVRGLKYTHSPWHPVLLSQRRRALRLQLQRRKRLKVRVVKPAAKPERMLNPTT